MNLDRHIKAHKDLFINLVRGDGDSAEKHKDFYDEYLAVMDLSAEFYLQTVETVFIRHALARGLMQHRGRPVNPGRIRRVALMTIEGENDDITGLGQCAAAHRLCSHLAPGQRLHYEQAGVGHYGIFNGSRFRNEILPRMAGFMRRHDRPFGSRRPMPRPPERQSEAWLSLPETMQWFAGGALSAPYFPPGERPEAPDGSSGNREW